jgi:hypothetical protein
MLLMQQFSARPMTRGMQLVEAQLGESLEEFLRRRYETEGRTTVEIATELGLNNGTISRWLAHFGIQARFMGPRQPKAVV